MKTPRLASGTLRKFPDYTSTYELAPGKTVEVSMEAGNLYFQKSGRPRDLLIPEAPDIFFPKDIEGREVFHRNAQGRVESLLDRRNNEDIVYRKVR